MPNYKQIDSRSCCCLSEAGSVPSNNVTGTFSSILALFRCLKYTQPQESKCEKFGTLHEFACHPYAGVHANLLCIVPILLYVLPKQARW